MKKFNTIFASAFIFILIVHSTLNIDNCKAQWVATYNGPSNGNDMATSIAVDGMGNIYVTGFSPSITSQGDYTTIKYNYQGAEQWIARYSAGRANSIAVDNSGNVYVTGEGYEFLSTYPDYTTVKYNSAGVQQWIRKYKGPGNGYDAASKIVADGSGNVYVTGRSSGSGTNYDYDYATIKYNSTGDSIWVRRYNGPGNSEDEANSIALDDSGNIYVTGSSSGSGTNFDYATIKYNTAGIQQWVARYNGPGNYDDKANSIVVDGSEAIYVTGGSYSSAFYPDYSTIKYNSVGEQQWVARYDGPGNWDDVAYSIDADNSGNVFVTGYSYGNGTSEDYATIKYNSAGIQQWVARYSGSGNSYDIAWSITVDDSSNVYVTGDGSPAYFVTIKYNSTGIQQWISKDNIGGGRSVAVDGSDNVYVTGYSYGIGTNANYATLKNPQLISGISQISSEIPPQYNLSQNYPNPFNPTTNLEFGISKLEFVSLKIFDVMGREIKTLVNERLAPGRYNYQFSIINYQLPSGVYFYRLTAGEFTDTKRMMLIK